MKDSDVEKEVEGIQFIIEKGLDNQFEGIEVDYRQNMFSKGFAITLQGSRGGGCGH
ncbi:hypothetical protein [Alkaliphilus serpentinus]|uniref:hypothetical protein n=1 Tax=Alkaliphilus serpentinus TaxID=1482731 RepID=UPI00186583D9|nr:hypothetical protein [Alkaliphilus serpentinus]